MKPSDVWCFQFGFVVSFEKKGMAAQLSLKSAVRRWEKRFSLQVEETNGLRSMDKDVLKVWHGWNSHRGGWNLTKQVPGWNLLAVQKTMISRALRSKGRDAERQT